MDSISLNNTLSCISGSHNWGKLHKPKRFDGTDLFENDNSEDVPDIDNNLDKYKILSWPMEPGDAISFNFKTLHGAPANTGSKFRRRVFSTGGLAMMQFLLTGRKRITSIRSYYFKRW